MLIFEYRICMPMTVEEYHRGFMWSVIEASKAETGGGEGVEVQRNEPFENRPLLNGQYASGQYTKKIYHLNNVIRAFLPRNAGNVHEESWNAYPYCRTILTNPEFMKKDMEVKIESLHLPDRGTTENAHNLPSDMLQQRQVFWIDISKDEYLKPEDIDANTSPNQYHSERGDRGPLLENWTQNCEPVMCCYKLVTIHFKLFGFQRIVENYATDNFYPRIFTKFNREVFCWIDRWFDLTMAEIREIERQAQLELEQIEKMGTIGFRILSVPTKLNFKSLWSQSIPWFLSIPLIISIVVAALLPGFVILSYYQSIVLATPTNWTIFSTVLYIVKFCASSIITFLGIMIYTDVSFPLIMYAFGAIFSRTDVK